MFYRWIQKKFQCASCQLALTLAILATSAAQAITDTPKVTIKTPYGSMVAALYSGPDVAPMHVESFLLHVERGDYNETLFHRVIPNFVIQGGDPNTKSDDKSSYGMGGSAAKFYGIGNTDDPTSWKLPAEFNNKSHKKGTLSMARAQDVNSAGSQFFICLSDLPHLDGQYTVIGEVVEGFGVLDAIAQLQTDARDVPTQPVTMELSVTD